MPRARTAITLALAAAAVGCASILGIKDRYDEQPDGGGELPPPDDDGGLRDDAETVADAPGTSDGEIDADTTETQPVFVVPPSAPGTVDCADTAPCTAQQQRCCLNEAGSQCVPSGFGCSIANAIRFACDETADCSNSYVCCFDSRNTSKDLRAECRPYSLSCQALCRTDDECVKLGFQKCAAWTCPNGPVIATCDGVGYDPRLCFP